MGHLLMAQECFPEKRKDKKLVQKIERLIEKRAFYDAFDDETFIYDLPMNDGDEIEVCIDSSEQVDESDETNNCLTYDYVGGSCDYLNQGDLNGDGNLTSTDSYIFFEVYLANDDGSCGDESQEVCVIDEVNFICDDGDNSRFRSLSNICKGITKLLHNRVLRKKVCYYS